MFLVLYINMEKREIERERQTDTSLDDIYMMLYYGTNMCIDRYEYVCVCAYMICIYIYIIEKERAK